MSEPEQQTPGAQESQDSGTSAVPLAPSPFTRALTKTRLLAGTAAVAVLALGLTAFALSSNSPAQAGGTAVMLASQSDDASRPVPRTMPGGAPFSFADLVERVSPSVVTVTVDVVEQRQQQLSANDVPPPLRDFFKNFGPPQQQRPQKSTVMGSGFVIDTAGYIVTNNHVVENGKSISVKFKDGRVLKAQLIGTDPATDVALLKVDAGKPLPAVAFASDRSVRVGDWVVAVGNPFGLSNTVTAGIVSSLGREIGPGNYNDFIQIDAPINQGNSGGPAFDIEGRVIGMNTLIFSPSGGSVGIGFAIPSSTVHDIVAQLKAHGKVARGFLGVQIQSLTPELADSAGIKDAQGAIVASLVPDGPAAKAGIRQGDIITAVNGAPVTDSRDVTRRVAAIPAGSDAHFSILRDGAKLQITAHITARPADQLASNERPGPANEPAAMQAMGLGLAGLTPELRRSFNIDDSTHGVLITKVDPDSDAAGKGIQPGDVIVSIGSQPMRAPEDVRDSLARAKSQGRDSVLALVEGQGGQRFVPLGIAKS